jgi:hypothetical protein
VEIEEEESNNSVNDLADPDILKDAKIKKSGSNTVFTVELTNDMINKLINSGVTGDMGRMGDIADGMTGDDMTFTDSELVIVVSSDGYIISAEIELKASQQIDEPTLGMSYEMSFSVKMDLIFVEPNEEITVEIPEGYLDYPLQLEEDSSEL